jgi:hypothetical protein
MISLDIYELKASNGCQLIRKVVAHNLSNLIETYNVNNVPYIPPEKVA